MAESFLGNCFEFLVGFFLINIIFNLIEIGILLFILPLIGLTLSTDKIYYGSILIKIILFGILVSNKKVMGLGFLIGFILEFLII